LTVVNNGNKQVKNILESFVLEKTDCPSINGL